MSEPREYGDLAFSMGPEKVVVSQYPPGAAQAAIGIFPTIITMPRAEAIGWARAILGYFDAMPGPTEVVVNNYLVADGEGMDQESDLELSRQ